MADDKTVHWASTDEGKAKLSRAQRAAWKRRRANGTATIKRKPKSSNHETQTPRNENDIPADIVAYTLGRIEGYIEQFASSAGVSTSALAYRLGKILSSKTRG